MVVSGKTKYFIAHNNNVEQRMGASEAAAHGSVLIRKRFLWNFSLSSPCLSVFTVLICSECIWDFIGTLFYLFLLLSFMRLWLLCWYGNVETHKVCQLLYIVASSRVPRNDHLRDWFYFMLVLMFVDDALL